MEANINGRGIAPGHFNAKVEAIHGLAKVLDSLWIPDLRVVAGTVLLFGLGSFLGRQMGDGNIRTG
ncbi:MAG: hypothetical protein MIO87_00500 [Methanomassiliicoccales archaeon]|nr:hypothetical protein [Methanomassiliicoccales archaeon]TFG57295.1 MAG: hypothetical protein E4H30_00910 [Methanomassiliicoccus sp.]